MDSYVVFMSWLLQIVVLRTLGCMHLFQLEFLSFLDINPRVKLQFSSVAQSCLTLCKTHGLQHTRLPCHQLRELAQTHIHRVSDAIQPFHPLLSPSPPALNLSQHQGLFQWSQFLISGGQSIGVSASASVLPMNIQDWFPLGWTDCISLQFKGLSRLQHDRFL